MQPPRLTHLVERVANAIALRPAVRESAAGRPRDALRKFEHHRRVVFGALIG